MIQQAPDPVALLGLRMTVNNSGSLTTVQDCRDGTVELATASVSGSMSIAGSVSGSMCMLGGVSGAGIGFSGSGMPEPPTGVWNGRQKSARCVACS